MYKGATLKAKLVRILRERGHPGESFRPFAKWLNKEIVEALVQSDVARTGEATAGVNQVYQRMLETEDGVEAAGDLKGASQRTGAHLLAICWREICLLTNSHLFTSLPILLPYLNAD